MRWLLIILALSGCAHPDTMSDREGKAIAEALRKM